MVLVTATSASATAAAAASAATTTAATSSTAAAAASASAAITTASASRLEVRVTDHEPAPHQPFHIVYGRAVEQGCAVCVNQHLDFVGVDNEVILSGLSFDAEHVLNAALRAGHNHYAEQPIALTLLLEDILELLGGQFADL